MVYTLFPSHYHLKPNTFNWKRNRNKIGKQKWRAPFEELSAGLFLSIRPQMYLGRKILIQNFKWLKPWCFLFLNCHLIYMDTIWCGWPGTRWVHDFLPANLSPNLPYPQTQIYAHTENTTTTKKFYESKYMIWQSN